MANKPDTGGVRLAEELGGFQDAIGASRVGVDVRRRVAGGDRLGPGTRSVAPGHP